MSYEKITLEKYDKLLILRGLLSVGVMIGHSYQQQSLLVCLFENYRSVDNLWINGLIRFLTVGYCSECVWCFFILSGYLMGKLFLNGKYELNIDGVKRFYKNRFFRIVPLLLTAIIVCYVFDAEPFDKNPITILNDLFFISNIAGGSSHSTAWSVSYEMQFYFMFPFIFALFRKVSQKTLHLVFLLCGLLFLINYLNKCSLIYLLWHYLFLFILGYYINIILRLTNIGKFRYSGPAAVLSIAMAMVCKYIIEQHFHNANARLLTMSLFFGAAIFFLEIPTAKAENDNGKRSFIKRGILTILIFLGNISYGVYLWHWLVLQKLSESKYIDSIVNYLISHGLIGDDSLWERLIYSVIFLGSLMFFTFLLSWLSFILIELPFRPNLYNRKSGFISLSNKKTLAIYSSVMITLLFIMSATIYTKWITIGKQYKEGHQLVSMVKEYISNLYLSKYSCSSDKPVEMNMIKVLDIYPGNFMAIHKLGIIYEKHGEYKKAEEQYQLAIQINPQYDKVYNNLLQVLHTPDNDNEILKIINDRMKINKYPVDLTRLIYILNKQGRLGDVFSVLKYCRNLHPNYNELDIMLGDNLERRGTYDDAIKHYFSALRIYGTTNYLDAYLHLGDVYYRTGNLNGAAKCYRFILKSNSGISNETINYARINLGRLLLDSNYVDDAIREIELLLKTNRQFVENNRNVRDQMDNIVKTVYEKTGKAIHGWTKPY
ncbi:MAG: acyltransferase family protein [Nitrospirae bacterium]|nr:acyltransferase family protein [Nitrospirota bacterium]